LAVVGVSTESVTSLLGHGFLEVTVNIDQPRCQLV
jgi:hypothetical protein